MLQRGKYGTARRSKYGQQYGKYKTAQTAGGTATAAHGTVGARRRRRRTNTDGGPDGTETDSQSSQTDSQTDSDGRYGYG